MVGQGIRRSGAEIKQVCMVVLVAVEQGYKREWSGNLAGLDLRHGGGWTEV